MHECNAAKADLLTTARESLTVPPPSHDSPHEYRPYIQVSTVEHQALLCQTFIMKINITQD